MWVGGNGLYQMQIRVPVDDETTWFLLYTIHKPEGVEPPVQDGPVVSYEFPFRDEHGHHIVDFIEGQDVMAWVTQGRVADRTAEHLGKSDVGILMLRRMFKENIAAVEDGNDPLGTVREPHDVVELPLEKDKFGAGYAFATQWIDQGSMRYSPQKDALKQLHLDAAIERGEVELEEVDS